MPARPPLTRPQLDALYDQLGPHQVYLNRLCKRLQAVGVSGEDPIYLAALQARDALQGLRMHVHYARCDTVPPAFTGTPPPE